MAADKLSCDEDDWDTPSIELRMKEETYLGDGEWYMYVIEDKKTHLEFHFHLGLVDHWKKLIDYGNFA